MFFEACGEGNGQNAVTRVAWSPCGLYLYAARRRDAVRCWDAREELGRVRVRDAARLGIDQPEDRLRRRAVRQTHGERGTDGVLRAFDLRDGTEKAAWRACDASEAVSDFAFHPHASWGEPGAWPRRSRARGASVSGHRRFKSELIEEDATIASSPVCALRVWQYEARALETEAYS